MPLMVPRLCASVLLLLLAVLPAVSFADYVQETDRLSALWSFYSFNYIEDGRVISHDEGGVTTSEGQSYAMLRAVWENDHAAFDTVWNWTRKNLAVRNDRLLAWKFNHGRVLDRNAATDADVDIALALVLASRRFSQKEYLREARLLLADIWDHEVIQINGKPYLTGGNWAVRERYPTIHVAYLAPYAYETFAEIDPSRPWRQLVETSYEILHWIYFDQGYALPPEILYVDRETGALSLTPQGRRSESRFSYDAFPLFWRVAMDAAWYHRKEEKLRRKMLGFFEKEWKEHRRFFDRYSLAGIPESRLEGLPLYATVHALALVEKSRLASTIRKQRLDKLWDKAMAGEDTPYYLHNWLWFGRAFELKATRHFAEFLDFLIPMDPRAFSKHFPWVFLGIAVILYILQRLPRFRYRRQARIALIVAGFLICVRYLLWRLFTTLNFLETAGPVISMMLWVAEVYCFSTVVLLVVQVGVGKRRGRERPVLSGYYPSVDIFVPIYSESLEILEKTIIAAQRIRYSNKQVHVCDDSHRKQVAELAESLGATYIKGPKEHAKAGNLNNAMTKTTGELLVVFDTDHIPVESFLEETVPYFHDPKVGMLQTPHHFYNADIFQRAFNAEEKIPNEQDMFNHGIQGSRDGWGGAFFVGSGAVFRREAMERIGGFQLLSITEDIHTSQHLHAKGWRSVFVNKDLVGGLTAENLSSYIVQRRRWMLGCLQILFRDNPLRQKGLALRHRFGYFASLYYFLFPLARVVFWITPLYYLLFHWHPIFADVTVLLAYLIPYMIALPLISDALVPGYPRMLWGNAYENIISFPLFRSMFDLFLPKKLGFKVTPKGVTSKRRVFDRVSAGATLVAAGITVVAIAKGLWEFYYFGIERDAYFFNIGWASYNVLLLAGALLVAWERPQRRVEERLRRRVPCTIRTESREFHCMTHDIGLGGLSIETRYRQRLPEHCELILEEKERPIQLSARLVRHERCGRKGCRCGFAFEDLDHGVWRELFIRLFCREDTWKHAHDKQPRSNPAMVWQYLRGMAWSMRPLRVRRRLIPRRRSFRHTHLVVDGSLIPGIVVDRSCGGQGILIPSLHRPAGLAWRLPTADGLYRTVRHVYTRPAGPFLWRVGLEITDRVVTHKATVEQLTALPVGMQAG